MRLLVTGGAGFIGAAVIRYVIGHTDWSVLNVDKLTYAGNLDALASVVDNPRYRFLRADICDRPAMTNAFREFGPNAVMHLAAESHVDRSIDAPDDFIQTNVAGTATLLQIATDYRRETRHDSFCFHHVSTDEVYGDLAPGDPPFTEYSPYAPSSPYAASKAAADHMVRAWHRTFGLPVVISNCSNNYGPYQYPEKLIPLMILNALEGKPLPVYGDGQQIRDWLYVDDHVRALVTVLTRGTPGHTYNIGGDNECTNLDIVHHICDLLDDLLSTRSADTGSHRELVTFVEDRPGHDRRYAIDGTRIRDELGWTPTETGESGLAKTVRWYLDNREWAASVQQGKYGRQRLGVSAGGER